MAGGAIGIFDSGVGGLTVVRAMKARLPHEELIYLGDTARVPYGSKSAQTVLRYSRMSTRFLLDEGVKMIVVACNTASAYALEALRDELAVPVLGVIEPGARAALAATRTGKIGVIGTLGTVRSGAYPRALAAESVRAGKRVEVAQRACPLLVPLAEEGWLEGDVPERVARRYLGELAEAAPDLDVLVLGCTHYPLLAPLLERVAREIFGHTVSLVDSAETMAAAAETELTKLISDGKHTPATRADAGSLRCFVTDDARIDEIGARFLGGALASVTRVDL
jgi:glutamate racemase